MVYNMQAIFTSVVQRSTSERRLIGSIWLEIEMAYHDETRYYHTMKHLHHVYSELLQVQQMIQEWDTVLFALFYHDIIYIPTRPDNELKSAELAKARLESLQLPITQIEKCMKMIMATKNHAARDDDDINFFTDADLSILGSNRPVYVEYSQDVRKEYAALPESIYTSGRKNVLQQFLKIPAIFKTEHFFKMYEKKARENIEYELETL